MTHRRDQWRDGGRDGWRWRRKQRTRFKWRIRRRFHTIADQRAIWVFPRFLARGYDRGLERAWLRSRLWWRRGFSDHTEWPR